MLWAPLAQAQTPEIIVPQGAQQQQQQESPPEGEPAPDASTDEAAPNPDTTVPPPVIYTLPANAPAPVILVSLRPQAAVLLREAGPGVDRVFEALDHPEQRRVRHRESGVVCSFFPKTEAEIRLLSASSFECIEREGAKETIYAAQRVVGANAQTAYMDAIAALKGWDWNRPITELRGFAERNRSPEDYNVQIYYPRERGLYFGFRRSGVTIVRIAVAEAPNAWIVRQQIVLDGPRYGAREFGRTAGQIDSEGEYDFAALLGQIIAPSLASRMQIVAAPQVSETQAPEGE
jgi:hypothetical protein